MFMVLGAILEVLDRTMASSNTNRYLHYIQSSRTVFQNFNMSSNKVIQTFALYYLQGSGQVRGRQIILKMVRIYSVFYRGPEEIPTFGTSLKSLKIQVSTKCRPDDLGSYYHTTFSRILFSK